MRALKEQAKHCLASHPLCPSISGKDELMQNNRQAQAKSKKQVNDCVQSQVEMAYLICCFR